MKECPRCHAMTLEDKQVLNLLSRRGSGVYICNDCGDEESFIDTGLMKVDQRERDFVAKVGK